jgi:3-phosphoshikimate 1-carboxyvinyltransferase
VLKATSIDAKPIPDLVPILALAAAVAEGETVIYNAERLRIKESDRLKTVYETLNSLGADIEEKADGLVIRGVGRLNGGEVSSFNDHRIAMMAGIAAIVCEKEVTILQAEAVNKSYPGFFDDLRKLGAKVRIDEE